MSDVITKPGLYRQRNGGKAEVFAERDGWWYGYALDDDGAPFPESWRAETGRAGYASEESRDITGPFHEPPTPPEGFELKPKDYVAKEGDRCAWGRATAWHDVSGWKGCCAQELEDQFSDRSPVYIASPIPKPAKPDPGEGWRLLEEGETVECDDEYRDVKFKEEWSLDRGAFAGKNVGQKMRQYEHNGLHFRRRLPKPFRISEHGCGVYETRDGREAIVTGKFGAGWTKDTSVDGFQWYDDGRTMGGTERPDDLVRYIGPLPKQETWTCMGDLRWRRPATGWASMTPDVAQILNTLEQRWTNGTDSEWRPVPATNE